MEKRGMDHSANLIYLKKIEGQIRGVQRMIEEKRYCIDILTQLHSVVGAILSVEDKVLKSHLENCVVSACASKSEREKETKINEILDLITKFRR
jgi:DNA-binding FrmR family transcriptional regulator